MYRFLFLSVFFLISCAPTLQQVVSDAKILEKLDINDEKISSFRGMAQIYFSLKEGSGSVEAIVVAKKPDSLRIETGNFFGVPLTALTLYKDKLTYYAIPEEKFYTGQASSSSISGIMPLGLSQRDLLGLIFFSKATYERFSRDKRFQIKYMNIEKRKKEKYYYPSAIRLTVKKTEEFMQIKWSEYNLNPPKLSSRLFKIKKPAQARLIKLEAGALIKPLLKGTLEK